MLWNFNVLDFVWISCIHWPVTDLLVIQKPCKSCISLICLLKLKNVQIFSNIQGLIQIWKYPPTPPPPPPPTNPSFQVHLCISIWPLNESFTLFQHYHLFVTELQPSSSFQYHLSLTQEIANIKISCFKSNNFFSRKNLIIKKHFFDISQYGREW